MLTIIGIDEAGYSPLLGPLVVSAAAFEAPSIPSDWWAALDIPRAARRRTSSSRPAVDDSKKLYTPARGLARLELAVLAFLRMAGHRPTTLRQLLGCLGSKIDTEPYPWYHNADVSLPVAVGINAVPPAADDLRRVFDESGIRFVRFRSVPLLTGEYNRELQRVGNKSIVLFRSTVRLVDSFLQPGTSTKVFVDKQGARKWYGGLLSQHYFGCRLQERVECREVSAYSLSHRGRRFDVSFSLQGETVHLPIALASMCSKYIRELFMEMFNRYWRSVKPGIPRTSGYRVDARRFIHSASDLQQYKQAPPETLIRSR